jgi:hypothetical protein
MRATRTTEKIKNRIPKQLEKLAVWQVVLV